MRVLIVQPFGHMGGHSSSHTKYLVRALAHTGVHVTLLTFDGLLGRSPVLNAKVTHISFVSKIGAPARLVRRLPNLFPSRFVQGQLDRIFSTICTFLYALRQNRKERYDVIHLLDACISDYAFPWFGSVVSHRSLVLTLHRASREVNLENWRAKFREAVSNRQIMLGFQLWLNRLLGTRLAIALRKFLYQRASKRNRLAFICYTSAVRDSYLSSPFYENITRTFLPAELLEAQPITKREAREHLGLSQSKIALLHFGTNHRVKNFEVIFRALQGLQLDYELIFAGKVRLAVTANIPWKLAQKYGLQQNTTIVDKYITDEEAAYYFYAADALILSHQKDFKGASGVLPNAAQFNLPVIAAAVGEVGELVEEYGLGLTFEAEDPLYLRGALLSFLSLKEDEKERIRRNLGHFAVAHSPKKAARRLVELYQSLCLIT